MHLNKVLAAAALAFGASAQNMNLTQLLGSQASLSSLVGLLGRYPNIASSLASAKKVTLFAPNNAAIQALTRSGLLTSATESDIQNILDYHVVPEVVYASAIGATPVFAPTLLTNSSYTNVTGGQVVEAQLSGGNAVLTSGLKMSSTVVKAVSVINKEPLRPGIKLLTPHVGSQLHQWCSTHHRPSAYCSTQRFDHRTGCRFDCFGWSTYLYQPPHHPGHRIGLHYLCPNQRCLCSHWQRRRHALHEPASEYT